MTPQRDPHDAWRDQLSLLADGDLSGGERAVVEQHLADCDECRRTLRELKDVKVWLAADAPTAADRRAPEAWPPLRAALPSRRVTIIRSRWLPPLLAASIVGIVWLQARRVTDIPVRAPTAVVASQTPEARAAEELEQVVRTRLAALPADQSAALSSSLGILDAAIRDARVARAADPRDEYVATYLDDLLRRKVDALRKVVELANANAS